MHESGLLHSCRRLASVRRWTTGGIIIAALTGLGLLNLAVFPATVALGLAAIFGLIRFKTVRSIESLVSTVNGMRIKKVPEQMDVGDIVPVSSNPWGLGGNILLGRITELHGEHEGIVEILSEPIWETEYVPHKGRSFEVGRGDHASFYFPSGSEYPALWAEIGEDGKPIITW